MTDVPMVSTMINDRWPLLLPEHRAAFPEWPWWEKERLDAMHQVITTLVADSPEVATPAGETRLVRLPLVYDIGAEEGDMPGLWASWGARVAMFEPDPKVWPNMRAIWQANQLPDPYWCFAGFAGPEHHIPDDVKITDVASGDDSWPACAYGPVITDHGFCNLAERPDIPCTTIDLAPGTPDVITVDVEGAELEVLRGADITLGTVHPVVFVSVHPDFMRGMYAQTPDELHTYMRGHGYVAELLAVDHEHHFKYTHPNNFHG